MVGCRDSPRTGSISFWNVHCPSARTASASASTVLAAIAASRRQHRTALRRQLLWCGPTAVRVFWGEPQLQQSYSVPMYSSIWHLDAARIQTGRWFGKIGDFAHRNRCAGLRIEFTIRLSENEDSAACCNSDRRFRAPIAPWPCQQEFA
eukprot:COSAG01_NODE_6666_length_3555_cov_93.549479_1_plen_148_part_10